ncbi:MAG: GNAT family N-acetyltransferase [Odoribacter sp.]
MITLKKITAEDSAFIKLTEVYTEAFPPEERRRIEQLKYLMKTQANMYFNAIECDGVLAGLFVYWDFTEFYYLEHLAVYGEMRNKKIGQQVLDWIKEHLKGSRLLEVEPADNEIAIRRIHYYQRNDYKILTKDYVQPSYDGTRSSLPLWIMGNEEYTDQSLLKKHVEMIKEQVYNIPREKVSSL